MRAKQYIRHSLCYFVKLMLLLTVLYGLLFLTGYAKVSAEYFLQELFTSKQGIMLFAALVVLACVYPLFGFVRREVAADIIDDREKIINGFITEGYSMKLEQEGVKMAFRMSSPFGRFWLMFDDSIVVTPSENGGIVIEGPRKQAVLVQFRIEGYMRSM